MKHVNDPNKRPPTKAKTEIDAAIYERCRSLLPFGYLAGIAKSFNVYPYRINRILLGYFDANDKIEKEIREKILTEVETLHALKLTELRRVAGDSVFAPLSIAKLNTNY